MDARADATAQRLISSYQRAGKAISDELAAIGSDPRHEVRRRRLRALDDEITRLTRDLDQAANNWVRGQLPSIYSGGMARSAAAVGAQVSWTTTHEEAARVLAGQTLGPLLQATRQMRRDSKALIRAAVDEESLNQVLLGRTAVQSSRELAGELARRGISAVTYKNGARHLVDDYADMVIRSQSAIAYNTGTINEARRHGIEYAVIGDGMDCGWTRHEDGDKANGKVVPLEEALENTISHPRCRRNISPLPGVTAANAKQVEDSGQFRTTPLQDESQRQADLERTMRLDRHRARLTARAKRLENRKRRVSGI